MTFGDKGAFQEFFAVAPLESDPPVVVVVVVVVRELPFAVELQIHACRLAGLDCV